MRTRPLARLATLATALAITAMPAAAPAGAEPAIDGYQPYVAARNCTDSAYAKPGVVEFKDVLISRMGGSNGGIVACSGYEHMEGRALDWMNNASVPAEAARVQKVLDWMLATDADGNAHAMARRLGIAYVIWNERVINLYDSDKSWKTYTCDGSAGGCHRNHVHFAFSWAGANRQTSWFTADPRPAYWYPDHTGPVVPADHRTSAATVYNPATRTFDVFATGTDGALKHTWWDPATGFGAWASAGGGVTGRPSAVYNPVSGSFDVFATGTDGFLRHTWWDPATGFGAWATEPNRKVTGTPTAVYNPVSHSFDVFATGTDGSLNHTWWIPATGFGSWAAAGGGVTGTPSAVYNPVSATFDVFATGTDGFLRHTWWTPATGFGAWATEPNRKVTGAPSAVYNPVSSTFDVFAIGTDGSLNHTWWTPATGFGSWAAAGGGVTGAPSAVYNPVSATFDVFAIGTDGSQKHTWWTPATGFGSWATATGASVIGAPVAAYNPDKQSFDVFAVNSDRRLNHTWWLPATGFGSWATADTVRLGG
ncbi:hypothetical protein ACIRBX_03965 [Kitasatospora sp. NPDC096147]|uniref:hypothetical protein n=1 Tax=Kitasatospora sp. NPDC096147 TaxID=3364093 RepID=UPI00380A3FF5